LSPGAGYKPCVAGLSTVLVVDDEEQMRILFRVLLEDSGFSVVGEAADGVEAVALAADVRPDLVTMDLDMPRMNGAEATRTILANGHARAVVIVSGSDSSDLLSEALDSGAFAHVAKTDAPTQLPGILYYAFASSTGPSGA